jgi:predicted nucleic acid-binding Zn finger protein
VNPRPANARALVAAGAVRLEGALATVVVGDHGHRVRFVADGGAACTCSWWARYRGGRGKCKHVLAAELARAGQPTGRDDSVAATLAGGR